MQKGDAVFVNCTFLNNTASLLGGALFVDRGSSIAAISSYFEGICCPEGPHKGTFMVGFENSL